MPDEVPGERRESWEDILEQTDFAVRRTKNLTADHAHTDRPLPWMVLRRVKEKGRG